VNWVTTLRYAVAKATADESGGLITWRQPPGVYLPTELGIYNTVLPESPNEAIALGLYPVTEGVETTMGVQFRYRAATDARLDEIEDRLSNSWTQREAGTLEPIELIMCQWSSGASLGQDSGGRLTRSANFYLTANRPLRYRT